MTTSRSISERRFSTLDAAVEAVQAAEILGFEFTMTKQRISETDERGHPERRTVYSVQLHESSSPGVAVAE